MINWLIDGYIYLYIVHKYAAMLTQQWRVSVALHIFLLAKLPFCSKGWNSLTCVLVIYNIVIIHLLHAPISVDLKQSARSICCHDVALCRLMKFGWYLHFSQQCCSAGKCPSITLTDTVSYVKCLDHIWQKWAVALMTLHWFYRVLMLLSSSSCIKVLYSC